MDVLGGSRSAARPALEASGEIVEKARPPVTDGRYSDLFLLQGVSCWPGRVGVLKARPPRPPSRVILANLLTLNDFVRSAGVADFVTFRVGECSVEQNRDPVFSLTYRQRKVAAGQNETNETHATGPDELPARLVAEVLAELLAQLLELL